MFSKLIPRDEKFFDLFDEIASRLSKAAKLQTQLFSDPARMAEHVTAIKAVRIWTPSPAGLHGVRIKAAGSEILTIKRLA